MRKTVTHMKWHQSQTETTALYALSKLSAQASCVAMGSTIAGLEWRTAQERLRRYGPNLVSRDVPPGMARQLWRRLRQPLNALLIALAAAAWALGDRPAAALILLITMLATGLSFLQEYRATAAATRLRSMVTNCARVRRRGRVDADADGYGELPIEALVPGDIIALAAGDMIPADVRLLETKDFFVNQAALTGEALPTEKFSAPFDAGAESPFDLPNMCFMGENVQSGYATGVIIRTGSGTLFGELADQVAHGRPATAFDLGVRQFTLMMIRCIAVMVPVVLLINGLTKHDWLEAMMFALAIGVGLTPEMLPMIITVNLANCALVMARAKVIVKRLDAIQNLGAMDILCTDKTGTLTQDRIILKRHLDLNGNESERVLRYAWINSHFQSGLKNLLDVAVLKHAELHGLLGVDAGYAKVDEIPFDFSRRRLSVVVATPEGRHLLVCKGAVEEIMAVCSHYEADGRCAILDATHIATVNAQAHALNDDGFRVVAIAYKDVLADQAGGHRADETELTLAGYIAFLDPPKESAAAALDALAGQGVAVKILTGDNPVITRKVCREVGFDAGVIVPGTSLDSMQDAELAVLAERTRVFAKLTPSQKERVVRLLRGHKHVVGFLGDGINDSPALRAADVGLSVDGAVDIAKEAADIILLEKNLMVLQEGVLEGRRVFANMTKYLRMGASSNIGNMFSVLGASLFLPFLPLTPIQVLANNLLYDCSQMAIPSDSVDAAEIAMPCLWDMDRMFKFMLLLGAVSSLFDYLTFAMLLWFFDAWRDPALFQTGWFIESLLSQTLIIHILRTARIPFFQSRASVVLSVTSAAICALGIWLPHSAFAAALGLRPLPPCYWILLLPLLCAYAVSAFIAKRYGARLWTG